MRHDHLLGNRKQNLGNFRDRLVAQRAGDGQQSGETGESGLAPRQFALEPNGKTLLVTNTGSGQVEAVNVGQLP